MPTNIDVSAKRASSLRFLYGVKEKAITGADERAHPRFACVGRHFQII